MAKAVRSGTTRAPKKTDAAPKPVQSILITQPKPEGDKSPYYDLARKYGLTLEFHPFIRVEGLTGKEFRKQKVDIAQYSAVVFTSRNAVDHFFRIAEEVKVKVSQEMKYFCITEAVALYLQKFILYRKRKVFFSADGSTGGLLDVIGKHKNESYLIPAADGVRKEVAAFLTKHKVPYAEATLYRTVSNDIAPVMEKTRYDMIVFFTPFAVQTMVDHDPEYKQAGMVIGAFGPSAAKAVEDAGLKLEVKAPAPNAPSMVSAMEQFFAAQKK